MKRIDPLLRTVPWRVAAVFAPLERILHRLEADGTVEIHGAQIVFREDGKGGWYDLPAALRGVVEFHRLAESRHQLPVDVRANINSCKAQALRLRVSQAESIIRTVQIGAEIDRLKGKAA